MRNNVICDNQNCKQEFEIKLERKDLGEGVFQLYFECPGCGQIYQVTKTNSEIEELQNKIDYYAEKASKMKPGESKAKTLERMQELIKTKKQKIETLNQ